MATVPKLYSLEEIASITHTPKRTVQYWIYAGKLKSVKAGRRRLVTEHALATFLDLGAAES